MPVEWTLDIVFKCSRGWVITETTVIIGATKLLQHGMMVVERVLEKRLCEIVTVD